MSINLSESKGAIDSASAGFVMKVVSSSKLVQTTNLIMKNTSYTLTQQDAAISSYFM